SGIQPRRGKLSMTAATTMNRAPAALKLAQTAARLARLSSSLTPACWTSSDRLRAWAGSTTCSSAPTAQWSGPTSKPPARDSLWSPPSSTTCPCGAVYQSLAVCDVQLVSLIADDETVRSRLPECLALCADPDVRQGHI